MTDQACSYPSLPLYHLLDREARICYHGASTDLPAGRDAVIWPREDTTCASYHSLSFNRAERLPLSRQVARWSPLNVVARPIIARRECIGRDCVVPPLPIKTRGGKLQ